MFCVGTLIEGALQDCLINKKTYVPASLIWASPRTRESPKRIDADGKADLAGCIPGWGCERVIEHELTKISGTRTTAA